jgi:hypothetical protein
MREPRNLTTNLWYNQQREQYRQVMTRLYAKAVFEELAAKATSETARIMRTYARTMYSNIDQKKDLAKMHRDLANDAQIEVIKAYEARPGAGRPSYRQNDTGRLKRYADGKMLSALKSKNLINTNEYGIGMFDQRFLDRKAKQWYRLNFGTAPRGSKAVGQGSLKMFGQASSRKLQISRFKPGPAFMVPTTVKGRGLWSNKIMAKTDMSQLTKQRAGVSLPGKRGNEAGSGKALYVVFGGGRGGRPIKGSFSPRVSRGIRGARFLDAGVKSINDNYGNAMYAVFKGWHDDSVGKAKSASNKTVTAKVRLGGTNKKLTGLPRGGPTEMFNGGRGVIYYKGPRGGLR